MRGLLRETTVKYAMLGRILRHIDSIGGTRARSAHGRAMRAVRPLVAGMLAALRDRDVGFTAALVDVLPEECERFATKEGLADLRAAMPTSLHRIGKGQSVLVPDARAPARWEFLREAHVPRQVWGRLLEALMADIGAGGGGECTTIRVDRASAAHGFARLIFLRFDERAIEELRGRPLLILDATLHLGVGPVLDVVRREMRYDQGRVIVQVMGRLLRLPDLRKREGDGYVLTDAGRRVVAQLGGWFAGRSGYVLARKDLVPLLTAEAARYPALRQIQFTSPGRERGWDANPTAIVFAGLGRYAKSGRACEYEARALRSYVRGSTGSTQSLAAVELRSGALVFKGRGRPLRYRGELVERTIPTLRDPLAAAIQDADRVATVRQFIGRNRTGTSKVLLLRGDPTVGADVLIEEGDLPLAVPMSAEGPGGKHRAPRTGNDLWEPATPHLPPVAGLTASSERSGGLPQRERRCVDGPGESLPRPGATT